MTKRDETKAQDADAMAQREAAWEETKAQHAAAIAEQKAAWDASKHTELFPLLSALTYCQHVLPPWINGAVRELIDRKLQSWTQWQIDAFRWVCVCEALERRGVKWDHVFEHVSENMVAGTPAACGPDMVKTSYDEIQRRLPPEQRRQRTYTKRR